MAVNGLGYSSIESLPAGIRWNLALGLRLRGRVLDLQGSSYSMACWDSLLWELFDPLEHYPYLHGIVRELAMEGLRLEDQDVIDRTTYLEGFCWMMFNWIDYYMDLIEMMERRARRH
jgi:hypothetical protein